MYYSKYGNFPVLGTSVFEESSTAHLGYVTACSANVNDAAECHSWYILHARVFISTLLRQIIFISKFYLCFFPK